MWIGAVYARLWDMEERSADDPTTTSRAPAWKQKHKSPQTSMLDYTVFNTYQKYVFGLERDISTEGRILNILNLNQISNISVILISTSHKIYAKNSESSIPHLDDNTENRNTPHPALSSEFVWTQDQAPSLRRLHNPYCTQKGSPVLVRPVPYNIPHRRIWWHWNQNFQMTGE